MPTVLNFQVFNQEFLIEKAEKKFIFKSSCYMKKRTLKEPGLKKEFLIVLC